MIGRGLPKLEDAGGPDRATDRLLERLFRDLQRVEPTNESQRGAYPAGLDALNHIVTTREPLLNSSNGTMPDTLPFLRFLLFLIGLVVMAVATLLDTRHRRAHLFILSALALVIWLTLVLVVSLDYPVKGTIAVAAAPLREFVDFRAAR